MQKITSIALVAAIAAGSLTVAAAPRRNAVPFGKNVKLQKEMPALSKKTSPLRVIDQQPAGNLEIYSRSSVALFPIDYEIYELEDEGFAGIVVYGEGDPTSEAGQKVYLKNPFSQFPTDTYLEGTLSNDVIKVSFPQDLADIYDEEEEVSVLLKTYIVYIDEDEEAILPDPNPENQVYTFVKGEDGEWIPAEEDAEKIIGMTYDDGTFTGYGDIYPIYSPVTAEMATVPEGAQAERWSLVSDGMGRWVNVSIADNTVYMQNIIEGADSLAPLVGTLDADGVITVASNQFLGVNDNDGYLIFAYAGEASEEEGEYGSTVELFAPTESVKFTPDASGDMLTADCDITFTPVSDPSSETYWSEDLLVKPSIFRGKVTDMKPATPEITGYSFYESFGFGYVEFDVPAVNAEQQPLDARNIYYNMLLDGEVFTFLPYEYGMLTEEITDIPWDFTDNSEGQGDIKRMEGAQRVIMLYSNDIESIGIQSFYKDPSTGEVYASDVATYLTDASVDGVTVDTAVSVEYYDLLGRLVTNPSAGVYVKKAKMASGTIRTVKTMVR